MDSSSTDLSRSQTQQTETEWKFQIVEFGGDDGENQCPVWSKLVGPSGEISSMELDCVLETSTHKLMSLTVRFSGWMNAIPDEDEVYFFTTIPAIPSEYQSLIESGLYIRGRASPNRDWELSVQNYRKDNYPDFEKAEVIKQWFRRITDNDDLELF